MSFLGNLFDPAGSFDNGVGGFLASAFDPASSTLNNFGIDNPVYDYISSPAQDGVNSVVDTAGSQLEDFGNNFKKNPFQLLYAGADPASVGAWNKLTNQNMTPYVDQLGGETNQSFKNAQARGIDTTGAGYMSTLAHMIAGSMAGGGLANLAGTAGASAGMGATEGAGSSALGIGAGTETTAMAPEASLGSDALLSANAGNAASLASGTLGRTVSGAGQGTANAIDNNRSLYRGAIQGGIGGGLGSIDYGGAAGMTDPLYKGALNGAINGGVKTGMTDSSNTGYGALLGMLQGAFKGGSGGPSTGGYNYGGSPSPDGSGSGVGGMGNIAATLGQMYLAHRASTGIDSQIGNLNGLYAPNSPYAHQMQQTLDRQDAAGGRRSQYGTRAVELQAALANAASRNAPTLSNLYAQQRNNRFGMVSGLLAGGRNSGMLGGLGQMFNQPQQPGMDSYNPVSAGPSDFSQINSGQMNNDVNNTLPGYFGG